MAWNSKQPAKIGIGYSTVKGITKYRSKWPENVQTADQLMVMKMTNIDNTPLCVLYNFALHPTTLSAKNYSFSADFVNFAAKELRKKLGDKTLTLFINGAQAELIPPERATSESEWDQCASIGSLLAREVKFVWEKINPSENLAIAIVHQPYSFKVKPTSRGLKLPLETYHSELNCILLNKNVLLTIPGELSCVYEQEFRKAAQDLGMENLSVLGLTNDAHGYIILPEAWEKKTQESELSFGGKNYGSDFKELAKKILQRQFEVLEKARL
jgi:hypothetical protein